MMGDFYDIYDVENQGFYSIEGVIFIPCQIRENLNLCCKSKW